MLLAFVLAGAVPEAFARGLFDANDDYVSLEKPEVVTWTESCGRSWSLIAKFGGADRITVRNIGHSFDGVKPSVEIRGESDIMELLRSLKFVEEDGWFHCMCYGDHEVEFFRNGVSLGMLSHHHGQSLRWNGGFWRSDVHFHGSSAKIWRDWFSSHGYRGFQDIIDEETREQSRLLHAQNAFLACFPEKLRPVLSAVGNRTLEVDYHYEKDAAMGGATTEVPEVVSRWIGISGDQSGLATSSCRAMGLWMRAGYSEFWYSSCDEHMEFLTSVSRALDPAVWDEVARISKGDRDIAAGFARLYFRHDFSARVRDDARHEITVFLAEATLRDGMIRQNQACVVEALEKEGSSDAVALLKRVASGEFKANREECQVRPEIMARLILVQRGIVTMDTVARWRDIENKTEGEKLALSLIRYLFGDKLAIRSGFATDGLYYWESDRLVSSLAGRAELADMDLLMECCSAERNELAHAAAKQITRLTGQEFVFDVGTSYAEMRENFLKSVERVRGWWTTHRAGWQPPKGS